MKKIIMYQKPTCGTCKKQKAYLAESKIAYAEIDIVKSPPSRDLLEEHIDENNLVAFINIHSKPYREL